MATRGRQKLGLVERKRRAALRQMIKAQELQDYVNAVGDNKDEIEKMTGPGRRPKPLSYRVREAWQIFDELLAEVREIEEQEGLEHVPLEDVHDPLVEKGTIHAVGRKAKDEFTVLDQDLLKAERKLAAVYSEWKDAGTDEPERAVVDGKPKGRKPTPYPERVNELLLEIEGIQLEIKKREEKLSKIELMERQVKLLRDFARTVRKGLKKEEVPKQQGAEMLEKAEREANTIAARVERAKRREEEPKDDIKTMRRSLVRPSLFEQIVYRAEQRLSEVKDFERKNVAAKELREKSEMLDLMIAMEKKKKQMLETRREIAKLEKELADLQKQKESL